MQDRFKFRAWDKSNRIMHYDFQFIKSGEEGNDWICFISDKQPMKCEKRKIIFDSPYFRQQIEIMQSTGLKDKNGKLIYEGDVIVIPNQYPFYDYKNEKESQNLYETNGEIKGETILNYVGVVEWIYSQWQYVYHCVNSNKNGISEGINNGLDYYGFGDENSCYEVIGNKFENPELLKECEYE